MKYIFFILIIILTTSSIYSQDIISVNPKVSKSITEYYKEDEIIGKLKNLRSDLNSMAELLKTEQDPKIVVEIINAQTKLKKTISQFEIELKFIQVISDEAKELIGEIKKKATAPSLRLAGDVKLQPTGEGNGNYFSPVLKANFKDYIWEKKQTNFKIQYDFDISIQSPSSTQDTAKMITNILSNGADGIFQTGLKFGFINSESAFMAGINTKVNWLNSRSTKNANLSSFAFLSGAYLIMAKFGPVVFCYEQEFRYAGSDSKDILSRSINKAMSGNLLIGINIDTIQLQLKYLLNTNGPLQSDERFGIRFGAAVDILN